MSRFYAKINTQPGLGIGITDGTVTYDGNPQYTVHFTNGDSGQFYVTDVTLIDDRALEVRTELRLHDWAKTQWNGE